MTSVEVSSIVAILAQGTGTGDSVNRVVPRTPLLDSALKRSTARVAAMPQWPWQAQPARKRSRTPSESEAGQALHFEDSDFYAHPSAGPNQVQVTDESVNDNMGGGKGDGGQGETENQFVQKFMSPSGSDLPLPPHQQGALQMNQESFNRYLEWQLL